MTILNPQSPHRRSDQSWLNYDETPRDEKSPDYFMTRDNQRFAGCHLLADFWQAKHLNDLEYAEKAMRDAVSAAGATLLHIHLHHFSPHSGISGVAVLAESHLSIHTWPERGFAAFDVFMCGDTQPERAIDVLREAFSPVEATVSEHRRGLVRKEIAE